MLHRAERADVLSRALAEVMKDPLSDPFEAEVVAVASRGIERWLSHRLAACLGVSPGSDDGVCANLQLPFLGRLANDALGVATGVDPHTDPWRPERLTWPLLEVVDACMDEPWLELLAGYLRAGGSPGDPSYDRRFACIRHLADLFDSYAVHRPTMILAWARGDNEDGAGTPLPADAVWQAELWRGVRSVLGVPSPPERSGPGCEVLRASPDMVDLPKRVSVFGLTRIPRSHLDVLRALAEERDVHLFALHPSPCAWERVALMVGEDPACGAEAAAGVVRHPLLRVWGRDSREMQLMLSGAVLDDDAKVEVHSGSGVASPQRLLGRIQAAIRDDCPPSEQPLSDHDPDDRSVQVHACHGRTRQAEVVRDAVLHLLAGDATLEPRDIVIMCPEIDEWAPVLRAAFDVVVADDSSIEGQGGPGRAMRSHVPPEARAVPARVGLPRVPYRLVDRSLRQTNPVLGAMAELLSLLDARLTASQVLSFASLAPVRQRFGFADPDLEQITAWVRATGIRWGLDAEHRGSYGLGEVGEGTWAAGLRRLLLGVAMSEEDLRLVGGVLPLEEVDSGTVDLAGRFAELVARIGMVVHSLSGRRSLHSWMDELHRSADLLFAVRTVDGWQRSQLDRLFLDVRDEAGNATVLLGLAEVRDLLADRLRGQPSRAAFGTGDLTMCTLVPMRSVPHRVVCLVGLDDGSFPRTGTHDGDDLLLSSREVGDRDRGAEDRQLLLDAVLAASDALIITYTGRDPRTNEELAPAVPVDELLDLVDNMLTGDEPARQRVLRHHPLNGFDTQCFLPGALGTDGPWSFDQRLLAGARVTNGQPRGPAPFISGPLDPLQEPIISLDDLLSFVSHPVRYFLRRRLGLSMYGDEDPPPDNLAVELDGLSSWALGERMLSALLAGRELDAVRAAESARGLLPPGALGRGALDSAGVKAVGVFERAESVASGPRTSLDIDAVLGDGRRVIGTVPDLVGDVIRQTSVSRLGARHRLTAWTRFLAATASQPERDLRSCTIGWKGGREQRAATISLHPLGPTVTHRRSRAVALLENLVDLHDRGLCEPLPIFCETSYAYASARFTGSEFAFEDARTAWTSSRGWNREDRDEAHQLVLGGVLAFSEIRDLEPETRDQGPGWPTGEASRFAGLAVRLWEPILQAARKPDTGSRRKNPV